MNLFADYVQPLTNWLQSNPSWALFITFSIALAESLAIVGSIVPGSVTMTAIGILAGSGIMRIDLTLIAAILGAVAGDSLSYALGFFYSERLSDIWPFKKYPSLLIYGKDFFIRHGGKSVLLGRFVGPLRSIIPVIAGIMHMKQWRFFLANFISAIGWSILYVFPGVIIGLASNELSTESATRLCLLILIILVGIWLVSWLIKWTLIKLSYFLKNKLHFFWMKLKSHPFLSSIYILFTPKSEKNHFNTAALLFLTIVSLGCLITLEMLNSQTQLLAPLNQSIHLLFQSVHTTILEYFFIISTQLTSTLTIISLYLLCCFWWFIVYKDTRAYIYLSSILLTSYIVSILIGYFIMSSRPAGLLVTVPGSSFPETSLAVATSFYVFLLLYFSDKYTVLTKVLVLTLIIMLALGGIGTIYLGDHWFTNVIGSYLTGITVCLIHYLVYRKYKHLNTQPNLSILMPLSIFAFIIIFSSISIFINFKKLTHDHSPHHMEIILSESDWWNQQHPILPLYRLNRIGSRISLLNIQYAGSLNLLQNYLEFNGWDLHTEPFFMKLLMKMNKNPKDVKLPLLDQLYDNKPPVLIMTYKDKKSNLILVMRIWESNYYLDQVSNPLWIGSVHSNIEATEEVDPITYLLPALKKFTVRRIGLTKNLIKATKLKTPPYIILIKTSILDKS